jgi:hypothetical protein
MFVRLVLLCLSALFLSGPLPQSPTALQQELDALTRRGFTVRWLESDLVELTDPVSSEKHLKSLREPHETELRNWASARGIPILEIDPNTVDTSMFTGWYNHWTEVPLSNSLGNPLLVGDINQDEDVEVYGIYRELGGSGHESRVYNLDSLGLPILSHVYSPYVGRSLNELDSDRDSLKEVTFFFGGLITGFEQPSKAALPTAFNFVHDSWTGDLDPGPSKALVGFFDNDSLIDFLYKGSEPDSADTTVGVGKVYVAEFNQDSNNFVRVWSTQFVLGQQSTTAGFAVEDFDRDGFMEFAVTEGLHGRVFFAENTGDNTFAQVWQDSTPYVNLYYQASGDVDDDGWPEFFVAATMSNGTWLLVYEANASDSYSLRFIFHLLSAGTFDDPTLLTSDIDGDGRTELVLMSGVWLHVFRSAANDDYLLRYLKRENTKDAVQAYDFNGDNRQDFIISKLVYDSLGRARFKADIYLASELVGVSPSSTLPDKIRLYTSYPNPFNSSTRIRYSLPTAQRVRIVVYDINGQRVDLLVNEIKVSGQHEVEWNASGRASGIYFCRLETQGHIATIKLLLLK